RNMDFTHPLGMAHSPAFLYGAPIANRKTVTFPAIGSVVSKLLTNAGNGRGLPPYVALDNYTDYTSWLGAAYRPFVPAALGHNPLLDDNHPEVVPLQKFDNLELAGGITLDRLKDRSALRAAFDRNCRVLDKSHCADQLDTFQAQALAMITDKRVQ